MSEELESSFEQLNIQESWRVPDQPKFNNFNKKTVTTYNSDIQKYCDTGRYENVKNCVAKGANIHVAKGVCLWFSSMNGHTKIVKFLLDENKRIKGPTFDYKLPVVWSAKNGHLEVLQLLLNEGADIKILHKEILMDFGTKGKKDVIVYLLEQGIPIITNKIFINNYIKSRTLDTEMFFGETGDADSIFCENDADSVFGENDADSVFGENICRGYTSFEQRQRMLSFCK